MHTILSNECIAEGIYAMKVKGHFQVNMGQFFMLRAWENHPILSRPISVCNVEHDHIEFLYKVVGEGTRLFAKLRAGDSIQLEGPFGNGFVNQPGRVALIGGGVGIAPLLYAAKQFRNKPDIFLGFRDQPYLTEAYKPYANELHICVNGNVLEHIEWTRYDYVYTCGPYAMMKAVANLTKGLDVKVYVSFEKRMACGIGACYGCSTSTKQGNKKVCTDGPVFLAEEVDWHEEFSL
ncbi:dihydroorotate dehydrogenase electron transfer subunit [Paenibacillus assamensis]|uniref:dihydroorotate dehydrogenase electron transfer subunit n=1 Tax=Paenibacillus assamensis TaxID=311244 RepID=UPI00041EE099|nr:dihydroorotate dehydrogenase electron transfer subunit [Paenibacillus assamensis]